MNIENLADAQAERAAKAARNAATSRTTLVRINRDVHAAVRAVSVKHRVPMSDVLGLAVAVGLPEAEARIVKQAAHDAVAAEEPAETAEEATA